MKELSHKIENDWSGSCVLMKDADFTTLFETGLEYSSPARGPWNIVHTGMLLPQTHEIFVCAQSCLRGVVLTAAEMNAFKRFSTITIEEHNILDGDMEKLIIDGVQDIVKRLSYKPRAILLYTSCIHHFIGCDLNYVYNKLHEALPDIDITDCYMNPTMRKTLTPPDIKMRQQLYSLLHETSERDNGINIIGNNFALDEDSDIQKLIVTNGFFVRDIGSVIDYFSTEKEIWETTQKINSYDSFQNMAKSCLNIVTNPAAILAGQTLEKRFGTKMIYLPVSYDISKNKEMLSELQNVLDELKTHIKCSTKSESFFVSNNYQAVTEKDIYNVIEDCRNIIGKTEIAIDYTATTKPLGLTKFLLQNGFNVTSVYLDSFISEEKDDFTWLKQNAPELKVFATVHPKMCILHKNNKSSARVIAIGQKSAYFTHTNNFVNIIENFGLWGLSGIVKFMLLLKDAFINKKDASKVIQIKGWGCCS